MAQPTSDFPHWKTVYVYDQIWQKVDENGTSLLEKVHKKLVEIYCAQEGRESSLRGHYLNVRTSY